MAFFSPISSSPARPEVHGHRGCRGLLPENTLPAFEHALALGVDVLELDVVVSADNQIVLSHEPWLAADLGRGSAGELIAPAHEQTYNLYQLPYAAIRRCVVGEWPHPRFPAQQPSPTYRPLLGEVLRAAEATCQRLVRPPVGYSIEIKSTLAGDDIFQPAPLPFVELVLAELAAVPGVAARTTLLSFDSRVLRAARQLAPALALCLLNEEPAHPADLFRELGFVPQVFGSDFQLLSAELVAQLRAAYPALRLVPWTVNEIADLRRVVGWQVDGITTDYPDRLLTLIGRLA
jgi:glycerophosphoryl diester phosphodiesterase